MIVDINDFPECPHYQKEIENTRSKSGGRYAGKVRASRRSGLPLVILEATGYHNLDGSMSEEEILLRAFASSEDVDLTPEEAIELGETLIALGKDCKKYPDRRIRKYRNK